ncbi:hypothetical protein [Candidatus Lokiarchaeum ossiferum]|uniref:hypothetical protein n=1 Tax=Candidatus Lokiarchaeum ossiferum TaxID=2951803 RepID=UPI00352C856E
METGDQVLDRVLAEPLLPTGIGPLDDLLEGGISRTMVTLLIGSAKVNAQILQQFATLAAVRLCQANLTMQKTILYIDGANRFNPYEISRLSINQGVGAKEVLDAIMVSRAFSWSNMVQTVAENLENASAKQIDVLVISGFTKYFEEMAQTPSTENSPPHLVMKPFEELSKMFAGLKRLQAKFNTRILLSTVPHSKSLRSPAGGTKLKHFANVILRMLPSPRGFTYYLDQHPFLPAKEITVNIPPTGLRDLTHKTLDQFF